MFEKQAPDPKNFDERARKKIHVYNAVINLLSLYELKYQALLGAEKSTINLHLS